MIEKRHRFGSQTKDGDSFMRFGVNSSVSIYIFHQFNTIFLSTKFTNGNVNTCFYYLVQNQGYFLILDPKFSSYLRKTSWESNL